MHAVPTFWWANMPKARQPYSTFLGFWMNTLSGERGNALTTSAPKIGRGSYLLVAPLGTFKSKTLTLPHRSSIVSPQNDAEVMRGLFDPTHVGTVEYMYICHTQDHSRILEVETSYTWSIFDVALSRPCALPIKRRRELPLGQVRGGPKH